MKFTRITSNPRQMGGMPCIRGLRIPVATVIGMIAEGMTETEILSAYSDLEGEDIHEALRYGGGARTRPSAHRPVRFLLTRELNSIVLRQSPIISPRGG